MNESTLHPLTKTQSDFAAENYGLVFSFLKSKGLDADEFHDVVILSYLQAVQIYDERPEMQENPFDIYAERMMQRALRFHLQKLNGRGFRGSAAEIPGELCRACEACLA